MALFHIGLILFIFARNCFATGASPSYGSPPAPSYAPAPAPAPSYGAPAPSYSAPSPSPSYSPGSPSPSPSSGSSYGPGSAAGGSHSGYDSGSMSGYPGSSSYISSNSKSSVYASGSSYGSDSSYQQPSYKSTTPPAENYKTAGTETWTEALYAVDSNYKGSQGSYTPSASYGYSPDTTTESLIPYAKPGNYQPSAPKYNAAPAPAPYKAPTTTYSTTTTTYSTTTYKSPSYGAPAPSPSYGAPAPAPAAPSYGGYQPHKLPSSAQKQGQPMSLGDFEQKYNMLKSQPAQPVRVRRSFLVLDPEISELGDASQKIVYAKGHNLPIDPHSCPKRPLPAERPGPANSSPSSPCDPKSNYRSYDGVCNNLLNPYWGAFLAPMQRFLPPAYEDGHWNPRGSTYNPSRGYVSRLPNARNISASFHSSKNISCPDHTHFFMQFGQFIDHDMLGTARPDYDCCSPENRKLPVCYSIDVSHDQLFSSRNRTCIQVTRSSVNCRSQTPWAEQFNGVTSFLDLSTVYGSNERVARALRGGERSKEGKMFRNQRLKDFDVPTRADLNGFVSSGLDKGEDFVAGDTRCQSQPLLLSFHNLFLLEHNRIADGIGHALQGQFGLEDERRRDEVIFQESRRILIAQYQNVIYKEFLPAVMSQHELRKHDLIPRTECRYDDLINPGIRNAFGTAAFRFGHSLVQDLFQGRSQPWRLSNGFADPNFAVKNDGKGFENELAGSCKQQTQVLDRYVTPELTNKLFANKKLLGGEAKAFKAASDLIATNLQRGRDHGLASYNNFRRFCGLDPISSMRDKPSEINQENWMDLAKLYKKPDDIDLFTGGLAEEQLPGGLLGPTFTYLIGQQFKFLKAGDRFYFTHSRGNNGKGLPENLQRMILARSMSDILCENIESLDNVQKNVFRTPNGANPVESCKRPVRDRLDFEAIAQNLRAELRLPGVPRHEEAHPPEGQQPPPIGGAVGHVGPEGPPPPPPPPPQAIEPGTEDYGGPPPAGPQGGPPMLESGTDSMSLGMGTIQIVP